MVCVASMRLEFTDILILFFYINCSNQVLGVLSAVTIPMKMKKILPPTQTHLIY